MAFNIDFGVIGDQFRGLQGRHPGLWPVVPRATLLTAIVAALVTLAHLLYWQGLLEELEIGEAKEKQLKVQFQEKMKMAVNLEVLREQKALVTKYVSGLEKQLPSKAEMDALLSDINQSGVGRSLQFELFKPGQVVIRDYYAELPINIRLSGRYHDLAAFTSDISNLSRIVTLNDLTIAAQVRDTTGMLTMEAVAKTYRYLDAEEVAEQRRLADLKKAQSKKRGAK